MAGDLSAVMKIKNVRKRPLPLAAAFRAARDAGFQCVTCEVTPEGTMILRAGPARGDNVEQAENTEDIIL